MPVYVAFLRAINLASKRTFPKDAIRAATESAGATEVETYINTGNVRLTSTRRSVAAVRADLERAYAADRGFSVPTVVFTPGELRDIVEQGRELEATYGPVKNPMVSLFAEAPSAAAARTAEALELADERCVVRGRAAFALIDRDMATSRLTRLKEFAALGEGTARTLRVLATLVDKWC